MTADPQRIASTPGMLERLRDYDRALASLDARIAASGRAGVVVNYVGTTIPPGLLAANGTVVDRATYPRLFAAIGTSFNTGGEAGTAFRVPNYLVPPEHGVWAITT